MTQRPAVRAPSIWSASPFPRQSLPCNGFAYCEAAVCWEPDAHKHTKGDCWLKFMEGPGNPEVRDGRRGGRGRECAAV